MNLRIVLFFALTLLGLSACQVDSPAGATQPITSTLLAPTSVNPDPELTQTPPVSILTMDDAASCLGTLKGELARVIQVIDGDTIEVYINGRMEHVRYLGIDTPELKARDPQPGRNAKAYNRTLVDGQQVLLIADTVDRDDYDRLLRFVMVDGELVNYRLIRMGYATTFIRDPDMRCADELLDAMVNAFRERIGIWQSIPMKESGLGLCPQGCSYPPAGCMIKGNISSNQEKLYHLPDEQVYPEVKLSPDRGELWFCTIEEAILNGWCPPRAE